MARAVTLGNGNILVGIDYRGQVRDFYFPYVGHANHVSGASGSYVHRLGVFVDDRLSWLDDSAWQVKVGCDVNTGVGSLHAVNEELQITLSSTDVVHNEDNIFIRQFVLTNNSSDQREIKVFFGQQFRIDESRRGDTGFYDPRNGAIIHYKGHHKFLINVMSEGKQFADYNIGLFGIEGKEGTYHDAKDGVLERNPIEHGSVDSVIGVTCSLMGAAKTEIAYWIAAGKTIDEVHDLNARVVDETAFVLANSVTKYWQAWVGKESSDLSVLSKDLQHLYKRSLTTIRIHSDNRGGIIASSDTDMLHHGRDTYSYVWPRDASIIANSLDRAGYHDVSQRYFKFMSERLERGGYLMHKYRVDGVLGSSWHPWIIDGEAKLPIQEDETALTVYMLWLHYEEVKDIEFIESLYNPFIEPAAEFMCEYMEASLGLPDASYDLWEEKYGIHTYTACAVYGALNAAAHFASMLGKQEPARRYSAVAQRIGQSITEHLYDEELGMFVKFVKLDANDDLVYDKTIDISSFFGPVYFGVLSAGDERIQKCYATVKEKLCVHSTGQGYIRYVGDNYYKQHNAETPNPWVIATLWMAQYYIISAESVEDLSRAYDILEWTHKHATPSGVLAEQMNPHTGEHLSTAPLVWSHAEFVVTVDEYLKKHAELSSK